MTQEQKGAVRARDEQISDFSSDLLVEKQLKNSVVLKDRLHVELTEAEARGAEEQRRKDAEDCAPRYQVWNNNPGFWDDCPEDEEDWRWEHATEADRRILYTRPANVAALEARIAELEGENTTLKRRVINAAENLLSIETPCMKGDNFAVTICSHFEDCEGEPCDNGWHPKATEAYEEIKTAIARHFRAALTREGGV
ncbi:hypothetical protein A0U94_05400 [Gluconobacter albidus]|uniref:hypothetical protein n=1 Tax=Gluconobacter albidus TaxID=318683 RepID=UPI00098A9A7A|nr:hypothetical protein [Gluconobacter albidus]AQS90491.1 hypothetical protein A0U94_05400 [Gluconobacter albidus]